VLGKIGILPTISIEFQLQERIVASGPWSSDVMFNRLLLLVMDEREFSISATNGDFLRRFAPDDV